MLAGRGISRFAIIGVVLFWLIVAVVFFGGGYNKSEWYDAQVSQLKEIGGKITTPFKGEASSEAKAVSFDLSKPPSTGCEDVVSRLQLRLVEAYSEMLRGVRYVNIWGYLETENKGDAAIWSAQQILLSMLGIQTLQSCRFVDRDCDLDRFNASLTSHAPNSAIIMAGGGNFNDYYWEDQPSRLRMVQTFPDVPVRAFPQSVHMTHEDRIKETKDAFGGHKDLMLAARDLPSWQWLDTNLEKAVGVPSVLVPDIAFMWGNRPDFRLHTAKTHDVLILARDDMEIAEGDSKSIPFGTGTLDLGGKIGNVTYNKVDWKFTHTPGIDTELPGYLKDKVMKAPSPKSADEKTETGKGNATEEMYFDKLAFGTAAQQKKADELMYTEYASARESGQNARAWAKAVAGFQLLGSAKFVITDRLHGHIMSTVIGTPHVLMDSKLGKNLNFHNTWTKECDCVRITENITDALGVARLWFEENGV